MSISRLFLIFLASCVNFLQMSIIISNRSSGTFILCEIIGAISVAVTLCMLLLNKFAQDLFQKALVIVAVFLFVWWCIGVGFMTFDDHGPFVTTGNGYFSAWVAWVVSCLLCAEVIPILGDAVGVVKGSAYEAVSG